MRSTYADRSGYKYALADSVETVDPNSNGHTTGREKSEEEQALDRFINSLLQARRDLRVVQRLEMMYRTDSESFRRAIVKVTLENLPSV